MKKLFVLQIKDNQSSSHVALMKQAKKQAKLLKKAHEKLFGKNTCEVVIITQEHEVFTMAEEHRSFASCCDAMEQSAGAKVLGD